MLSISEKIEEYLRKPAYPFHMPGHKRRAGEHDFTEIDGFDNLYRPTGIIAESRKRAAELFGADRSYYLVNGCTVGILAGILAAADPEKTVLVGPDCHKSVRHALAIGHLHGVYYDGRPVGPPGQDRTNVLTTLADIERELDWDRLPASIEHTLEDMGGAVSLVVVTSPVYEGVISDIARIADTAHRHGAVLLVDEAHGTHLGMHPAFGENSNRLGADLVVHSMHKTMSGLTQTALLHVNGERVDAERLELCLEMLQTSSPSYLLMESMDRCVRQLTEEGEELFASYADRLAHLRERFKGLRYIGLFETAHYDPGKLVLTVRENEAGFTAPMLYAYLRDEARLQLEFTQDDYALAMTSFADTDEGFGRLYAACAAVDEVLAAGECPAADGSAADGVRKTDCYTRSDD